MKHPYRDTAKGYLLIFVKKLRKYSQKKKTSLNVCKYNYLRSNQSLMRIASIENPCNKNLRIP